jgi:hypothetical protein
MFREKLNDVYTVLIETTLRRRDAKFVRKFFSSISCYFQKARFADYEFKSHMLYFKILSNIVCTHYIFFRSGKMKSKSNVKDYSNKSCFIRDYPKKVVLSTIIRTKVVTSKIIRTKFFYRRFFEEKLFYRQFFEQKLFYRLLFEQKQRRLLPERLDR